MSFNNLYLVKHIIDLASTLYVWLDKAQGGQPCPVLARADRLADFSRTGDEGFLPAVFVNRNLLLVQREWVRQDWPGGQIIEVALQCRYASFTILSNCKVCSLSRGVIDFMCCVLLEFLVYHGTFFTIALECIHY